MRFSYPQLPAEFEIPDEWWAEAGMMEFQPTSLAYSSNDEVTHTPKLREIEPPIRLPEYPKDFRGFCRERMVRILRGFVNGDEILPVTAIILPDIADISGNPFKYRIVDGVHRYHAAVAAGFGALPLSVRDLFQ
jgi:hypothetical protein